MPPTTLLLRPSWMEIDLGIIERNAREIRRIVGPTSTLYRFREGVRIWVRDPAGGPSGAR